MPKNHLVVGPRQSARCLIHVRVSFARSLQRRMDNVGKISMIAISAASAACLSAQPLDFGRRDAFTGARHAYQVNGNMLTIKTKSGTTLSRTKRCAPVVAVTKGAMLHVSVNSLRGIALLMPEPEITLKAVEVSAFGGGAAPAALAEGDHPWDLMPGSSMTNAGSHKAGHQARRQHAHAQTQRRRENLSSSVIRCSC